MSAAKILPYIERWALNIKRTSAQIEALHSAVGICDGPLIVAIWYMQDAYTETTSELVGDSHEWLDYYRNECAMGAKPREIESWGGRKMKLKTLKQLASVIAESSSEGQP